MEFKIQTGLPIKQNRKNRQPPVWNAGLNTFLVDATQSSTQTTSIKSIMKESRLGPFARDLENHKYQVRLPSIDAIELWISRESAEKTIEFIHKEIKYNKNQNKKTWLSKHVWVCARMGSGGKKHYTLKNPHWQRKVESKRTGCQCRITFKTYPDTKEVLGFYTEDHDHPIGGENACFIRIPYEDRVRIAEMLRMGIEPKRVVCYSAPVSIALFTVHQLEQIQGNIYSESNLETLCKPDRHASRQEFITMADIYRIQKLLEAESVRKHAKDSLSMLQWVNRCRKNDWLLAFKASSDPVPEGFSLKPDTFVLCIQTRYQQECFRKYGKFFAGIDATHNTTYYENMSLFTVLVRDRWGHGIPIAWMLSSNAQQETIDYFLAKLRAKNPDVIPERWMSDFDKAQINTIKKRYLETKDIYLCWWHVLHAWQQHLVITHYPELWELLKSWIRITDRQRFDEQWKKINKLAPQSFIDYINETWFPVVAMWSAVFRTDRSIWQDCDTNMLLEA